MRYKFPRIERLQDVLPAIEGRDEFFVGERDWGFVVNYVVNLTDSFPPVQTADISDKILEEQSRLNALRRECRGLLFFPDGRIMARRFQKFFNINEREETLVENIDFTQHHVILEKLDGSMITPLFIEDDVRWSSKMGITDVSKQVEDFVSTHKEYEEFARHCLKNALTPIFEWTSRKQRIVIDYPQDRLVLTAVRNTITGEYQQYSELLEYSNLFGLDVVKAYNGTVANMEMFLEETRGLKGSEGWVIRFDDGHMLKVKAEEYCQVHKTKDSLNLEKNIVELLINEKIDDVKPFMMADDRVRVEDFEDKFWNGINVTVRGYTEMWEELCSHKMDRKRFALERVPTLKIKDHNAPGIMFGAFDGKDLRGMIVDLIRKNCNTQTKISQIRYLWGGHEWLYHYDSDS